MRSFIVVLSTAKDAAEAKKIAAAIVEKKLAACCTFIPGARSIYRWQGKICDSREVLLVIKTTRNKFTMLEKVIRSLHSYDVPEIVALPFVAASAPYLKWMGQNV